MALNFRCRNFCNFRNHTVTTNILFMKYSSQLIILDTIVNLVLNNEFAQVFEAIVFVLHSFHHLQGV